MSALEPPAKPSFRGRLHAIAFFISIPAGITLVALSRKASARVAGTIYAVSLIALYGVSAAYHRLNWSPRALRRMRKLDHSTIFLMIAGTYTPLCVLVLNGAWRWLILGSVWSGALVGIVVKWLRLERSDLFGGIMYMTLGWIVILAMPQVAGALGWPRLTLLVAGGLSYTIGAIVLARRSPNPKPAVFGYHEIWHSFVVGGSVCHYSLILSLSLGAR